MESFDLSIFQFRSFRDDSVDFDNYFIIGDEVNECGPNAGTGSIG